MSITQQTNEKTIKYGIPKGKNYGGFLDKLLKKAKITPSPSTYKIPVTILPKK